MALILKKQVINQLCNDIARFAWTNYGQVSHQLGEGCKEAIDKLRGDIH
jgi:hypothetical protein